MIKILTFTLYISFSLIASDDLRTQCLKEHRSGISDIQRVFRCDYKVFDVPDKALKKMHNNYPEFVGIEGLKSAIVSQSSPHYGSLNKFKKWAKLKEWKNFGPIHHFDWWMFPISDESSKNYSYTVFGKEISQLKKDSKFMKNYRTGISLMFKSWCWNIKKGTKFKKCQKDQKWRNYTVRFRKVVQSMILFKMNRWLPHAYLAAKEFKIRLPKGF